MALSGTDRGQNSTNAAGQTSLTVVPASNLAAGSLAVLCVAYDNSGSAGVDPFSSISDNSGAGNTWTSRVAPLNDPGAANAGHVLRIFTCRLKAALTTAHTITVSFGGNTTVARSWTLQEITASAGSGPVFQTGNSTTGSSTTPSIVTGSITNGDMVIGAMGAEGNAAITGDSDTSNGSWSAQQTSGVGTTNAGSEISSQRKVVTGTGTQTYNLTITTADWCIAWIQLREVADTAPVPGSVAISISASAPIIGRGVVPPTKTLTTSLFAPNVKAVIPGTKSITITTFQPTVVTGGSFPTTSILDAFNRTNEGPPPSSAWTTGIDGSAGGFTVTSNQARANNGTLSTAYWNGSNFGPDLEIYSTLGTSIGPCRLSFRIQQEGTSGWDGYTLLAYTPTNELYVYRVDNGTQTQLGAAFSQTLASGDKFGASMIGNTITVYYKTAAGSWTALGTRTDSTYAGAGKFGIGAFDAVGINLDDFGGGTVTSGGSQSVTPGTASLTTSFSAPKAVRGTTVTVPTTSQSTSTFALRLALAVVPSTRAITASRFSPVNGFALVPGVRSLASAVFAPRANTAVVPGTALSTVNVFVPRLATSVLIPGTNSLSLSFSANLAMSVIPGVKALTISASAPSALAPRTVVPGAVPLSTASFAARLASTVRIPAVSFALASFASAAFKQDSVRPDIVALVASGFAVSLSGAVVPERALLSTAAAAPALALTVNPPAQALIISRFPAVLSHSIVAALSSLVVTGQSPIAQSPRVVAPAMRPVISTAFSPSVTQPGQFAPAVVSLLLDGFTPTALAPRIPIPGAFALTLSSSTPSLAAAVNIPARSLTVQFFGPSFPSAVSPPAGGVITTTTSPTLSLAVAVSGVVLNSTRFVPVILLGGQAPLATLPRLPMHPNIQTAIGFNSSEGLVSAPSSRIGGVVFVDELND